MFRRVWVLVLAGVILIGLWIGLTLFLPRNPDFKPKFLANAVDAPRDDKPLRDAPFDRKTGPNQTTNLGTVGVSYRDYLTPGPYQAIEKAAKAEFGPGTGWGMFYALADESIDENAPAGKMIPVGRMNALFKHGNDAVTIYRFPVEGKVKVRVWHRSPSIFNGG